MLRAVVTLCIVCSIDSVHRSASQVNDLGKVALAVTFGLLVCVSFVVERLDGRIGLLGLPRQITRVHFVRAVRSVRHLSNMISVVRSWLDTVGVGQVTRVRVVAAAQLASQSLVLLSVVRRGSLLGQSIVCCLVTALEALIISLGRQVRVVGLLRREYRMRGIWAIITCPKQSVTSHTCRCFGATLVAT